MGLFKRTVSPEEIAAAFAASAAENLDTWSDPEVWEALEEEGYRCRHVGGDHTCEIAFLLAYGTHLALLTELSDPLKISRIQEQFVAAFFARVQQEPGMPQDIDTRWLARMLQYDEAMLSRTVWAEKLYAMGEVAADYVFGAVPSVQGVTDFVLGIVGGQTQQAVSTLNGVKIRDQPLKLRWQRHGTSFGAVGSAATYEIVLLNYGQVVYDFQEYRGALRGSIGGAPDAIQWCLTVDGEPAYYDVALRKCKRYAKQLETKSLTQL